LNNKEFFNFIELWRLFWKKKVIILSTSFVCSLIAMVVSFLIPKTYEAEVLALMPESSSGSSQLSGVIGFLGESSLEGGGISSQVIKLLLESKNCRKRIIKRFDLISAYNTETEEDALEILQERTKIGIYILTGDIRILVKDRNQERVAEICNYYIELANKLNEELELSAEKPLLIIIDYATPPKEASFPKIKINMLVVFLLSSLFLMSYYAFSEKT